MPFSFYAPPQITFEEANPELMGAKAAQDFLTNAIQQRLLNSQAQYVTPMAQAALQKAQLENKFYSPEIQSRIGLQNAQMGNLGAETAKTRYLLSNPLLFGGEGAKDIGALTAAGILNPKTISGTTNITTENQPLSNEVTTSNDNVGLSPTPFNTGNVIANSILNKPFASAAYQNRMTQGFNWVHSPAQAKTYQIAQLSGAGVDPSESVQLLTSGKTVPEILSEKGFDPANPPDPDFLPTTGNITKLKQRQSALKEVESLGNFVTQGLAPYVRTVNGYSPLQIVDSIKNDDTDKQANFLAARALSPELSNVRLMLAQARTGKSAMQSMADKSLNNINAFQGLVSPEVFKKTQKIINDQLDNAFTKSEEVYTVGRNKNSSLSTAVSNKMNGSQTDPLGIR